MRDQLVRSLVAEARRLAKNYSKPDRKLNTMQETYHLKRENIIVLGEKTAAVIFEKTRPDSTLVQKALVILFHIGHQGGSWLHLFPGHDHLNGIEKLKDLLYDIEQHNIQNLFISSREESA